MKVQIKGFISYRKPYDWLDGDHGFSIGSYNPDEFEHCDEVLVREQMFEVEVPDNFDPRPQLVKALQEKKEKARKEFAETVMQIDRQINELLALEHTS
jgi:hypothetical protein